ncbi:MAG: hypothetical protein WCP70_02255 [Methanothrix sp.]
MSSAESKRLVIDASVATSTGERGQRGELCQAFLRVMIDETYHRLVMTREIGAEWDIHSHPFARRWRRSMNAKRRVDRPNVDHDVAFCLKIERASQTEKALVAMEKDLRLIEAARITDKRVISLDDTARSYFSAVSNQVRELRDILWVNPVNDDETPTKWLTDGAPIEVQRQLRP